MPPPDNDFIDALDSEALSARFEAASAADVLRWTWETFGEQAAATSSFQPQSLPLLHLIAETVPQLPVLFLDTGFHFPETLAFRDALAERWGLTVRVLQTRLGHDGFRQAHGELHRRDPDLCCYMNKVEPLRDALEPRAAWVTGIRRDQTRERAGTPVVAFERGVYKICPMAAWTSKEIWQYIDAHDLPQHPLLKKGYLSIGCAPCTRPVGGALDADPQDARAGRWAGRAKRECGLHTSETSADTDDERPARNG